MFYVCVFFASSFLNVFWFGYCIRWCFMQLLKSENSLNIFFSSFEKAKQQANKKESTQNRTNCWNFIYPFGFSLVVAYTDPLPDPGSIFHIFSQRGAIRRHVSLFFCHRCRWCCRCCCSVHSDEQHFYSNSFAKLDILTVLNEQELFRNSQEKSTHMQIFSIAREIHIMGTEIYISNTHSKFQYE